MSNDSGLISLARQFFSFHIILIAFVQMQQGLSAISIGAVFPVEEMVMSALVSKVVLHFCCSCVCCGRGLHAGRNIKKAGHTYK